MRLDMLSTHLPRQALWLQQLQRNFSMLLFWLWLVAVAVVRLLIQTLAVAVLVACYTPPVLQSAHLQPIR